MSGRAIGKPLRRGRGILFKASVVVLVLGMDAGCAVQPQSEQVEAIVKGYLLAHPEVIQQSLALQTQRDADAAKEQQQAALEQNYEVVAHDAQAPVEGNPKGDVTIVEFLDYHCHYCRAADPAMRELVKQDGNIRLVYHQFPILGPDSALAARSVLAAARQGKHAQMHEALFKAAQLDEATIDGIAQGLGLEMQRFRADRESQEVILQIQRDYGLAQALGINGTPGFLIGHHLMAGVGDVDSIKTMVALDRKMALATTSAAQAAMPPAP